MSRDNTQFSVTCTRPVPVCFKSDPPSSLSHPTKQVHGVTPNSNGAPGARGWKGFCSTPSHEPQFNTGCMDSCETGNENKNSRLSKMGTVETVKTGGRVSPIIDCVLPGTEQNLNMFDAWKQNIISMQSEVADSLRMAVRASRKRRDDGVRQSFTSKFRTSFVVRNQPNIIAAFRLHESTLQYRISLLRFGTTKKDRSSGLCR